LCEIRKLPETTAVLHVHWRIEAERVAELRDLAGGGAFAEHLLDGIAAADVDHQEDEGENVNRQLRRLPWLLNQSVRSTYTK
jgi:hypothetical protein